MTPLRMQTVRFATTAETLQAHRRCLSTAWEKHMMLQLVCPTHLLPAPHTSKGVSFASSPRYTRFSSQTNTLVCVPTFEDGSFSIAALL
jgi:hypothetical protein